MKGKRKAIGKKLRFEVFKRDKFSCQYCGSTPDSDGVVLNIDHIKPVKDGGDNNILNLITSCWDCNIGKGAVKLDDSTVLKKQRDGMETLEEKRQQLKMMSEWRSELLEIDNEELIILKDYFEKCWGLQGRIDWDAVTESKSLTCESATCLEYSSLGLVNICTILAIIFYRPLVCLI